MARRFAGFSGCLIGLLLAIGVGGRILSLARHHRATADMVSHASVQQIIQQALASVRKTSLGENKSQPVPQAGSRQASGRQPSVSQLQQQLRRTAAIRRVEVHRYDPQAEVFLTAGADGQPGRAGWDDDQDGVVDGGSELGALFSDDRCLAPTDPGYQAARRSAAHSRVISRGAYVPLQSHQALPSGERWRVVLHGSTDDRPWVWPVEEEARGERREASDR